MLLFANVFIFRCGDFMSYLSSYFKSKKKEILVQVTAYFIAIFLITTIFHSIDKSWGVISISSHVANILISICVIHSCYRASLFIAKNLYKGFNR